jgi:hypothetical protein
LARKKYAEKRSHMVRVKLIQSGIKKFFATIKKIFFFKKKAARGYLKRKIWWNYLEEKRKKLEEERKKKEEEERKKKEEEEKRKKEEEEKRKKIEEVKKKISNKKILKKKIKKM